MNYFRSMIGISPNETASSSLSSSTPDQRAQLRSASLVDRTRKTQEEKPHAERLASLVRAQTQQIGQLEDHLEEVTLEFEQIDVARNRPAAMQKLNEKKKLQAELDLLKKKLANTRAQQNAIQTATANLNQATLVEEGAVELKAVASAMTTIDLAGAMDSIQESTSERPTLADRFHRRSCSRNI